MFFMFNRMIVARLMFQNYQYESKISVTVRDKITAKNLIERFESAIKFEAEKTLDMQIGNKNDRKMKLISMNTYPILADAEGLMTNHLQCMRITLNGLCLSTVIKTMKEDHERTPWKKINFKYTSNEDIMTFVAYERTTTRTWKKVSNILIKLKLYLFISLLKLNY